MVGGSDAGFQTCQDLLNAIAAENVIHLGGVGSGCKAKLASNLILGLNRLVLAEGLVFAETLGLDLGAFLALLKRSPAYSVAMDAKGVKMLQEDFSVQSRVSQHLKDLDIIMKYADSADQELPLGQVHADILKSMVKAGEGGLDNAAVLLEVRRRKKPSSPYDG